MIMLSENFNDEGNDFDNIIDQMIDESTSVFANVESDLRESLKDSVLKKLSIKMMKAYTFGRCLLLSCRPGPLDSLLLSIIEHEGWRLWTPVLSRGLCDTEKVMQSIRETLDERLKFFEMGENQVALFAIPGPTLGGIPDMITDISGIAIPFSEAKGMMRNSQDAWESGLVPVIGIDGFVVAGENHIIQDVMIPNEYQNLPKMTQEELMESGMQMRLFMNWVRPIVEQQHETEE